MSKLLEIFGRAITVDTADLIWHWLNALRNNQGDCTVEGGEFDEIVELLGNIELDKAREKLNFYLFENPDCALGRMAAAAVCLHENKLDDAIEQLQSIYLRQPSNTMALYALGFCNERLGKEAEAVEFYQDCIKFKGHLQLPRQRMAAVYFKNGWLDKTIREYELLTTEHPEDVSSLVLLGYLYVVSDQCDKAVDTFNMAIVSHPDNFHDDSQEDEIKHLLESNQFDRAIESVQWLMDKVGQLPDLHVRMADILSRAGRAADAIVHYENALRIQPNYLEATIKLGTHYMRIGRRTLAAEQFNRAVEINDEIVDAYVGLAVAQHVGGDREAVMATLSLASAIQQNSTLLFSETATLHLQTAIAAEMPAEQADGDPVVHIEDVVKAHEARMKQSPRNADIHYKYGILMMIVGDQDRAVQSFENALEINPTHHRARSKLTLCLYEQGGKEAEIAKLLDPDRFDHSTLELHYRTAILYCDRRRFAEALSQLENTMKDNFTQPDALANVEVVLENLGLVDRATATWDQLTETAHNAISARFQ